MVDDEQPIQTLLSFPLQRDGYDVVTVADGRDALARFSEQHFDLVVLDLMLPKVDGLEVCRRLRAQAGNGKTVPIIMLTARSEEIDRVLGLEVGADDYLTKPFDIEELLARIRALLRRVEGDEIIRVADLEINTSTREVRRGEREIELTAREYELLEFMAQNDRRVLSRDLLLSRVWGEEFGLTTNLVDVYVGYLRRKVDAPDEEQLIRTVRGAGYALRGA